MRFPYAVLLSTACSAAAAPIVLDPSTTPTPLTSEDLQSRVAHPAIIKALPKFSDADLPKIFAGFQPRYFGKPVEWSSRRAHVDASGAPLGLRAKERREDFQSGRPFIGRARLAQNGAVRRDDLESRYSFEGRESRTNMEFMRRQDMYTPVGGIEDPDIAQSQVGESWKRSRCTTPNSSEHASSTLPLQ